MTYYIFAIPAILLGFFGKYAPDFPVIPGTQEEFGRVEITLHYEPSVERGSNQFAVWIQDQKGEYVKTLFVTEYTGRGGFMNQLDCLPMWVDRANPRFLPREELDAITGATPTGGWQTYVWDGRNTEGEMMPPGNYVFKVEGNQNWDSRILFSGLILTGRSKRTVKAQYEVDSENHDVGGSDMLMDVTATYFPAE